MPHALAQGHLATAPITRAIATTSNELATKPTYRVAIAAEIHGAKQAKPLGILPITMEQQPTAIAGQAPLSASATPPIAAALTATATHTQAAATHPAVATAMKRTIDC